MLPPAAVGPSKDQVERRKFVGRMVKKYRKYGLDRELANLIYRTAERKGIDPALAFKVVATESQFYPRARSPVGARGLAQLMPSTARVIKPGVKTADLYDPALNLSIGFEHLRDLMVYYDGSTRLALTAYNRGPHTVDRALAEGRSPYNGYHELVLRN